MPSRPSGPPAIEITVAAGPWPPEADLAALADRAIGAAAEAVVAAGGRLPEAGAELSLLFTDDAAVRALNARWRGQDRPTNVLSFPQAAPGLVGDVALAAETVTREAGLAGKPVEAHIAHLVIHGFLHCLGYDHESDDEAEDMEGMERAALQRIGIADPYALPPE